MAPSRNELSTPQIIVFDKSSSVRYTVGMVLGGRYEVEGYGEVGELLGRVRRGGVDLVILGVEGSYSGYEPVVEFLRKVSPGLPVLFLCTGRMGVGVSLGLSDELMKPFFPGELRGRVEGLLLRVRGEEERRGLVFGDESLLEERVRRWVGSWRISEGLRARVRELSSLPFSVLVEGGEGTGRGWVVRGLHYLGSWRGSVFVRLMGRGLDRGKFLEEVRRVVGGGDVRRGLDVYIEGVEDLTWEMQGYLGWQVEEGWVGGDLGIGEGVGVRLLGSRGLGVGYGEVRRGFGEMFWGMRLELPGLRERLGEMGEMVREVMGERGIGKRVSAGALEELEGYEWPGNVEELEGLVVRTGMMVSGEEIGRGDWVWGFEGGWKMGGGVERGGVGEKVGGEERWEERIGVRGKRGRGEERVEARGREEGVEVLISTLVHEVKNPLVAISTFAHLLPERYGDEEFRGEYSRLMGLEVRRLNGVLEMLLDYGQLGTPKHVTTDLSKWIRNYCEKNDPSPTREITITLENSVPPICFNDRHLTFVFERIFEEVQSKGVVGKEIRIANQEFPPGEKWLTLDVCYEEDKDFITRPSRKIDFKGDQDFEDLSLGLGLARRIMRKNCGEMGVIREEEGRTRILLQFQAQPSG